MSISYSAPKQRAVGQTILLNQIIYNGIPQAGFNFFSFSYTVGFIDDSFDCLWFSLEDQPGLNYCGSMYYDISGQKLKGQSFVGRQFYIPIIETQQILGATFSQCLILIGQQRSDLGFTFSFQNMSGMYMTIRAIKFQNQDSNFLTQ